jgi:PAS domain S-box-containing protein
MGHANLSFSGEQASIASNPFPPEHAKQVATRVARCIISGIVLTARAADLVEKDLLWAWVDSARVGLCVADHTGAILIVNRIFTEFFGVGASAIIGRDLSVVFSFIRASPEISSWAKNAPHNSTRELLTHVTGQPRHLSIVASVLRYRDGSEYRILSVTDVTDLRIAQVEIERAARQWDAINAGVVIADAQQPDLPIIYVNSTFERMTGYAADEVIGRNCRFLQGGQNDQQGVSALRHAIQERTNGYALLRNFRKDGSAFMNELFISPVRDKDGVVTHFIGVQHLRSSRS